MDEKTVNKTDYQDHVINKMESTYTKHNIKNQNL